MIATSPFRITIPLALGLLALATSEATAQPGNYAPPAAPQPAATAPAKMQKWGVGLRVTSQSMTSAANPDDTIEMGGGGIQARYRLNRRWEFEISVAGTRGERGADYVRESGSFTLTALFHMRPHQRWDWYLLAGFGGIHDTVTYAKAQSGSEEEFESGNVQVGAGIERRFRRFGIAAELRLISATRNDEKLDGVNYTPDVDGPIPAHSTGGQLNLLATYYF